MVATNIGVQKLIAWLAGNSATAPTHIGFGNDSTIPLKTDTSLAGELGRSVVSEIVIDENTVTFSIVVLSDEQNGQTLKEIGLLNASTSGDLFQHSTHADISKTSNVEIEYLITLRIKN